MAFEDKGKCKVIKRPVLIVLVFLAFLFAAVLFAWFGIHRSNGDFVPGGTRLDSFAQAAEQLGEGLLPETFFPDDREMTEPSWILYHDGGLQDRAQWGKFVGTATHAGGTNELTVYFNESAYSDELAWLWDAGVETTTVNGVEVTWLLERKPVASDPELTVPAVLRAAFYRQGRRMVFTADFELQAVLSLKDSDRPCDEVAWSDLAHFLG